MTRKSGILLHITSLHGRYGIGSFGKEAYEFIDYLKDCGQSYWQILPLTPTLFGNSPYTASSSFALNPNLISLDDLVDKGLITHDEILQYTRQEPVRFVDFDHIQNSREALLKIAYERFQGDQGFIDFVSKESYWLYDFAKYLLLQRLNNSDSWTNWTLTESKVFSLMDKDNINKDLNYTYFVQYMLFSQWYSIRKYANSKDIKIIGDFPFYVSMDSADCYSNPQLFKIGRDMTPEAVAGCPPDAFSDEGQLWGNPVYDFNAHNMNDYKWFLDRFKIYSQLYDAIRIDHFRGFESYWEIPSNSQSAIFGKWVKGPGEKLFNKVSQSFPELEIIAEDLGFITEDVHLLREKFKYPGMKVLQFAFNKDPENIYLPHKIEENSVVYTGTHDNDTINGWLFNSGAKNETELAMSYIVLTEGEGYNWGFIRTAWSSPAKLAITTYQDLMGFGSDFRMNTPSTVNTHNWSFKLLPEDLNTYIKIRLSEITRTYFRG